MLTPETIEQFKEIIHRAGELVLSARYDSSPAHSTSQLGVEAKEGSVNFVTKYDKAVQALLEEEDMEPTDRILGDTGLYVLGDTNHPVLWESSDSGTENAPVTLTGSPNGSTFRSGAFISKTSPSRSTISTRFPGRRALDNPAPSVL